MKHLLISPRSSDSFELAMKLAKELKWKTKILEGDAAEDFALGHAIKEGKKTKIVGKAKILKALDE